MQAEAKNPDCAPHAPLHPGFYIARKLPQGPSATTDTRPLAYPPGAPVVILGVRTVAWAPAARQVPVRGPEHDMLMVSHLAVSLAAPIELAANLAQPGELVLSVLVIVVNLLPSVATCGDVVKTASETCVA